MQVKKDLRKELINKRKTISNKSEKDCAIINSLLSNDVYKNADCVLCYVSLKNEINTFPILENVINSYKTLAVPFCKDNAGNMDFYIISSLDDLKVGSFGISEPDIRVCERLKDFDNSLLIVPALAFDKNGYRIGWGGGYYDRFLENFSGISAGLGYEELILDEIPKDKFDRKVDVVFCENNVYKC